MKNYPLYKVSLAVLILSSMSVAHAMQMNSVSIHTAARKNQVKELNQMLLGGSDVNEIDDRGYTALHLAASAGHQNAVAVLIAYNAHLAAKTPEGETASYLSSENGHDTIASMLRALEEDSESQEVPVPKVVNKKPSSQKIGSVGKASPIVEQSAQDAEGKTALHRAAEKGDQNLVQQLISQGADCNAKNNKGGSPLHAAAFNGHTGICEILIDAGSDLQQVNKFGNTALHVAALQGHTSVCTTLIDRGIHVATKNENGHTAAEVAEKNNQPAVHNLILGTIKKNVVEKAVPSKPSGATKGLSAAVLLKPAPAVEVDAKDAEGKTALHWAAEKGDLILVKQLLKQGANCTTKNNKGGSPLHAAAFNGSADICRKLIKSGAKLNATNNFGNTALHVAALQGNVDVCKVLLKKGADFVRENQNGHTALQVAQMSQKTEVVNLLLSKAPKVKLVEKTKSAASATIVAHAAQATKPKTDTKKQPKQAPTANQGPSKSNLSEIEIQLKQDTQEANASKGAYPLLHIAVQRGHKGVVELLLSKGAPIDQRNTYKNTALHGAMSEGNPEIVQLLIDKGADVDIKGQCNNTPLHEAMYRGYNNKGNLNVAKILVAAGAGLPGNDYGSTPLHIACDACGGFPEVVQLLVNSCSNHNRLIDAKDNETKTALHIACREGKKDLVVILLESSANPNLMDKYGKTALHYAAFAGHTTVVELLLAHKAMVLPSHIAMNNEECLSSKDLTELLIKKGADCKAKDDKGRIPLHYMALGFSRGRVPIEVLEIVIAKSNSLDAKDNYGVTPLAMIVFNWKYAHDNSDLTVRETLKKAIVFLIRAGADTGIKNKHGESPLSWAKKEKISELEKLLKETKPVKK